MRPPNSAPKVVFGPFEYDDLSGNLSKYGTPIRLQSKPLQILSLLVNRPGQLISREELQRHLWEGTTFVDFEQGLNSAVNKLRQALGDSADHVRYVETLPGRATDSSRRLIEPRPRLFWRWRLPRRGSNRRPAGSPNRGCYLWRGWL